MYTRIFSNVCIVLDLVGDQLSQGLPQKTNPVTPIVVTPLILTLDTSRPDKYKRWRQESHETNQAKDSDRYVSVT
jgi:hypothetical protein